MQILLGKELEPKDISRRTRIYYERKFKMDSRRAETGQRERMKKVFQRGKKLSKLTCHACIFFGVHEGLIICAGEIVAYTEEDFMAAVRIVDKVRYELDSFVMMYPLTSFTYRYWQTYNLAPSP